MQNGFYPDVTEVSVGNINSGYMNKFDGKIITSTSKVDGDPVHTDNISVKPGEEYFVCTQNYYDGKAVIFKNQDKIISTLPVENDANKKYIKITIPQNVNTLILNGTHQFLPRLFKINAYTQSLDSITGIKTILKDQKFNYENVELTKNATTGYWDKFYGNYLLEPVDKTQAQISYVPIKVKPCEIYRITGCSAWDARLWTLINAKGEMISYCKNDYSTNMTEEIVIPKDAAYLEINEILLNTTTKLEKAVSIKNKKSLDDKKWTAIGDSWTALFKDDKKSYVDDVAEITGATAVNVGGGGTGYVTGGPNNWNYPFYKHNPPQNTDICTIFGSFNDAYDANFRFGQKGDTDTETLWGAMLATINNVYKNSPDSLIGIIAPGPWGAINPFKTTDKMSTLNTHTDSTIDAMTISDFAEKYVSILKEFSQMYSLPFLDLYHESNLRPWNADFINKYYHGTGDTDTTHPNPDAMRKFIAPRVANFLEKIIK